MHFKLATTNASLYISNGNFAWDDSKHFTLKNVNINCNENKLIAVIGPVGSGKSSLLNAIIGEMYKISGSVAVKVNLNLFLLHEKGQAIFCRVPSRTYHNKLGSLTTLYEIIFFLERNIPQSNIRKLFALARCNQTWHCWRLETRLKLENE